MFDIKRMSGGSIYGAPTNVMITLFLFFNIIEKDFFSFISSSIKVMHIFSV